LRTLSERAGTVIGVSIQPGAIALTRMPSSAQATASDFVSCTMPAFDAAYPGESGAPKIACIEAMLTMAPLAAASAARQATIIRMVPVRLMSTTWANSDGSYSSRSLITPAALTSTASDSRLAAKPVTAAASVTSSLVTPSADATSTPMVR
jgi:hypothetical protein